MRKLCLLFMFFATVAHANQLSLQNKNTDNQSTSAPSTSSANASNGNQIVTVVVPPAPPPKIIVVKKTITRTRRVRHNVYHYNPNRIQLLVGMSKTKQEITQNACGCTLSATRVYEPDVGLQYIRDFGGFTGSIMGTKNESIYLGLGVNW